MTICSKFIGNRRISYKLRFNFRLLFYIVRIDTINNIVVYQALMS
jgi:hypothetical protein